MQNEKTNKLLHFGLNSGLKLLTGGQGQGAAYEHAGTHPSFITCVCWSKGDLNYTSIWKKKKNRSPKSFKKEKDHELSKYSCFSLRHSYPFYSAKAQKFISQCSFQRASNCFEQPCYVSRTGIHSGSRRGSFQCHL